MDVIYSLIKLYHFLLHGHLLVILSFVVIVYTDYLLYKCVFLAFNFLSLCPCSAGFRIVHVPEMVVLNLYLSSALLAGLDLPLMVVNYQLIPLDAGQCHLKHVLYVVLPITHHTDGAPCFCWNKVLCINLHDGEWSLLH